MLFPCTLQRYDRDWVCRSGWHEVVLTLGQCQQALVIEYFCVVIVCGREGN